MKIYLFKINKKEHPEFAKEFPTAKYLDILGNKYTSLEQAKKIITKKMLKKDIQN